GIAENPPGTHGQRLAVEEGQRFRRAEARGRAAHQQHAGYVIRHVSVYTLSDPPRTKPQSVSPRSAASSTASDEGAPTATSSGQPATAAFWTSSKERRPLTQSRCDASG